MVGNGQYVLFWEDRWLDGYRIWELAPDIYDRIPKRIQNTRKMADALPNDGWDGDISPELTSRALGQFLDLWKRVQGKQLLEEVEDRTTWASEQDGSFSAHHGYEAKFMGLEVSLTAAFTWKSKAPMQFLGNVAEIQIFPTCHQDLSMEKPATRGRGVHLHTLVDR